MLERLGVIGKRGPEAHRFPRRPLSRLVKTVEEAILDRLLQLLEVRE